MPDGSVGEMRVMLIGHPVGHSLSPAMQNAAFLASGLPHQYQAIDVDVEDLPEALRDLRRDDCLGANITVPHKLAAAPLMDMLDDDAQLLGAVNTIVSSGGRLSGHNTDITGARNGLLQPVLESLRGGRVLMAGAGGGSRAVIAALARSLPDGPADVAIAARRIGEGERVAEFGRGLGLPARVVPWGELKDALQDAGVVINCTPLGLDGEDPFENMPMTGRVVLDLAYAHGGTPLVRRARTEGAMALQGDQMLVHQGAEAFRLWTGVDAPVEAMRAALQQEIG